jgi:pimeloyl-ACP methyl ester carboxylesterase
VSGALGDRSAVAALAAHLAPTFTVIAFDRRGRGDSGDAATYSVEREVEDIEALIGEAGGSAFLFGHSSGAVLSLEAASALGDRVPRLALYEPPCIVDDSRPAVPPDLVERLSGLIADGRRGDAVASFLMEGPGVSAEVVESMRGEPDWPSFEALAHTLVYDLLIMTGLMGGDPAALERWASLDVPTLVMDGDASPPWQRNTVGTLAAALPHARRRSLAGQDHAPADELLAPVLAAYYTG